MRRLTALMAALLLSVAGAQYTFSKLTLAGNSAQALVLGGAEYASQSDLTQLGGGLIQVSRNDPYVRVTGLGHTLILPIDQDNERAATDNNLVQLDNERLKARTATLVGDTLYLPLDTLARGLGAQYRTGALSIPPSAITNVSSRAGKDSDRIVLDLSRGVPYSASVSGNALTVILRGISANTRTYATRGSFAPKFQVTDKGGSAVVSVPLGAGAGYRVFQVLRPGSVRLVIDVGPGLPRSVPALSDQPRAPLIVLDPLPSGGQGDPPLQVARSAAQLLQKAGWQVKLTRSGAQAASSQQREDLARRSQVFISLSVGRFPGAQRQGVTIWQPTGGASAQIINSYRDATDALTQSAVDTGAQTKQLSTLLSQQLAQQGIKAATQQMPRLYPSNEAPHAAFALELGWPQAAADQGNAAQRQSAAAQALALSVASFLKARAGGQP